VGFDEANGISNCGNEPTFCRAGESPGLQKCGACSRTVAAKLKFPNNCIEAVYMIRR